MRKITQISAGDMGLFALCDDGKVFFHKLGRSFWKELPEISSDIIDVEILATDLYRDNETLRDKAATYLIKLIREGVTDDSQLGLYCGLMDKDKSIRQSTINSLRDYGSGPDNSSILNAVATAFKNMLMTEQNKAE